MFACCRNRFGVSCPMSEVGQNNPESFEKCILSSSPYTDIYLPRYKPEQTSDLRRRSYPLAGFDHHQTPREFTLEQGNPSLMNLEAIPINLGINLSMDPSILCLNYEYIRNQWANSTPSVIINSLNVYLSIKPNCAVIVGSRTDGHFLEIPFSELFETIHILGEKLVPEVCDAIQEKRGVRQENGHIPNQIRFDCPYLGGLKICRDIKMHPDDTIASMEVAKINITKQIQKMQTCHHVKEPLGIYNTNSLAIYIKNPLPGVWSIGLLSTRNIYTGNAVFFSLFEAQHLIVVLAKMYQQIVTYYCRAALPAWM